MLKTLEVNMVENVDALGIDDGDFATLMLGDSVLEIEDKTNKEYESQPQTHTNEQQQTTRGQTTRAKYW